MDSQHIQHLIQCLNNTSISELEISSNQKRIMIKRNPNTITKKPTSQVTSILIEQQSNKEDKDIFHTIHAPFVGRFHRCASPDSEPFVISGDQIKVAQLLGFINANMQVYPVISEHAGHINEVLIDDGDAVGYGDALFKIKADI